MLEQCNLEFKIITIHRGELSLYLYNDFLDELFRLIEEIEDLFTIKKTYKGNSNKDLIESNYFYEDINFMESISYSEWYTILLSAIDPDNLFPSKIISIKSLTNGRAVNDYSNEKFFFEDIIKQEARKYFDH